MTSLNIHKGKIISVFIPGYRDELGRTHNHMTADFLGFEIEIDSSSELFAGHRMVIIERDTRTSAEMMKGDLVEVPTVVLHQLPWEGWDEKNKVFLNLSSKPCIKKWTS